jgi:putative copper export protein
VESKTIKESTHVTNLDRFIYLAARPGNRCVHRYYLFTSLIYLPVLKRHMQANALRDLLEQISAHLRPFFGGSLLIFLVTGTHLMLINESYLGLGNFFGNPWSILVVIKHVLVVTFLALAIFSERAFLSKISDGNPKALEQFQWALNINTIHGVVILLLTSIAQAG